jgi:hypothetical protein
MRSTVWRRSAGTRTRSPGRAARRALVVVAVAAGTAGTGAFFVPSAASPDACVGVQGVTISDGGGSVCTTSNNPGSLAAGAAANMSKADIFADHGGVSLGLATNQSLAEADTSVGGLAIAVTDDLSNSRSLGTGVSLSLSGDNSNAQAASTGGGTAIAIGNNGSSAGDIADDGMPGFSLADASSISAAAGQHGGVGIAMAVQQSSATGVSTDQGVVAVGLAAFSSKAVAVTGTEPECSGPGLALAATSDGAFCISVGGTVASG